MNQGGGARLSVCMFFLPLLLPCCRRVSIANVRRVSSWVRVGSYYLQGYAKTYCRVTYGLRMDALIVNPLTTPPWREFHSQSCRSSSPAAPKACSLLSGIPGEDRTEHIPLEQTRRHLALLSLA